MVEQRAPRRLVLQWHITERCNLRCSHCYQGDRPAPELALDELLLLLDQYDRLLARLRRNGPVQGHVTVTGGEPFLRRDCLTLLRAVAERGHTIAVLTNGTLIDDQLARELRAIGPLFVQVSIDGTPATHDRIRGRGNHARVACALALLRRHKLRTLVSFSAHRANYRELPAVVHLAMKHRVPVVWADRVIPWGRGEAFSSAVLDPHETRELFRIMAATRQEVSRRWFCPTRVAMHRGLQFLEGGGRPYRCSAGRSLLALMPNADLYPCRRLPLPVGNLWHTPLEELYFESPVLLSLRDRRRVSRGCEGCPHAERCGGGLRCLAYAMKGSPFVALFFASSMMKNTRSLSTLEYDSSPGKSVSCTSFPVFRFLA